ncbi:hypothetical protein QBC34DRAFT_47327 [Podospora aff. communis PSN243]|uniref:Uncharacterized protein n=1 Tax=Podospora aff. communis PSN243 TaxID=3040156 RepID=A0AAV9GV67_9PEZI|nr:hypothetical protein QBC34DRAFT_47327 [Podospora aff. communis PSN243]
MPSVHIRRPMQNVQHPNKPRRPSRSFPTPTDPQHGSGQHCDCHFPHNLSFPENTLRMTQRNLHVGLSRRQVEKKTTRYLSPSCNHPSASCASRVVIQRTSFIVACDTSHDRGPQYTAPLRRELDASFFTSVSELGIFPIPYPSPIPKSNNRYPRIPNRKFTQVPCARLLRTGLSRPVSLLSSAPSRPSYTHPRWRKDSFKS